MSKKNNRTIADIISSIENSYDEWKRLYEQGGNDPFWSDGVNANLVRNQIIYEKNELETVIRENPLLEMPKIYHQDLPPQLPKDYMARPDEIRANALKSLQVMKEDENLLYIQTYMPRLTQKEQETLHLPAIVRYYENLIAAIKKDDLITMRRYENCDRFLESFKSAVDKIRGIDDETTKETSNENIVKLNEEKKAEKYVKPENDKMNGATQLTLDRYYQFNMHQEETENEYVIDNNEEEDEEEEI